MKLSMFETFKAPDGYNINQSNKTELIESLPLCSVGASVVNNLIIRMFIIRSIFCTNLIYLILKCVYF